MNRFPGSFLVIRYEDFLEHHGTVLESIFDFCSLEYDASVVKYADAILQPAIERKPIKLDPSVRDVFDTQMDKYGYDTA